MSDERLLDGVDAPRALPDPLRARIEHAIVSGEQASGTERETIAGIDAPRDVPMEVRARVETAVGAPELFASIDEPRALPGHVRARIEAVLTRPPVRARTVVLQRVVAIAASLVLIGSSTLVAVRDERGGPATRTFAGGGPSGGVGGPATTGSSQTTTTEPRPPVPISVPGFASGPGGIGSAPFSRGDPPPFAFGTLQTGSSHPISSGGSSPAPKPAPRVSLRIGVVGGNAWIEAGFNAYVELLNDYGGAAGHRFELVATSSSSPATGTIANANLSSSAISTAEGPPGWAPGPLLETMAVEESVLRTNVFDLSSPVERQAHLIADAVFPRASPSSTAVIYTGDGVFGNVVPDAIETVLRERDVAVARVPYDPSQPFVQVPADVAFLSIEGDDAGTWMRTADEDAYRLGVASIYPMSQPTSWSGAKDDIRFISPYSLTKTFEAKYLVNASGAPLSAELIHGWVTAKALAVAVWRSGATSRDELVEAMRSLGSYVNGFAPPYRVREGTNARTPEGMLYEVTAKGAVARGEFRTDER